jgi:hypothetical protein
MKPVASIFVCVTILHGRWALHKTIFQKLSINRQVLESLFSLENDL